VPTPIATPVEVCLSPKLRQRQWNAERHPFRVELGPRAAQTFERVAKQHFRAVEVTLVADCGGATDLPYLESLIIGAHREPYEDVEDELQYTAVELETTLYSDAGEILWASRDDGVVGRPLPLGGHALFAGWDTGSILFFFVDFFALIEHRQRLEQARTDFGDALIAAYEAMHASLLRDADEIRLQLLSASPDRTGALGTFGDASGDGAAATDSGRAPADAGVGESDHAPLFQLAPLTDD